MGRYGYYDETELADIIFQAALFVVCVSCFLFALSPSIFRGPPQDGGEG